MNVLEQNTLSEHLSPLVTVIVTVHNRFELARRAIASVVTQEYPAIQMVVVDDASEVLFKIEPVSRTDFKQQVVRLEKNQGPGAARELGRRLARGKYIAYLDSDDVYEPDFLKEMVDFLEKKPEFNLAYCCAVYLPDEDGLTQHVKDSATAHPEILPCMLEMGRPWHSSSVLRRKTLTDAIGPWISTLWEDYDYDCRAAIIDNNIGYVPKVLLKIDDNAACKLSKSPDTVFKLQSYGMSLNAIAQHLRQHSVFKESCYNITLYYLLKSAARNFESGNQAVALSNLYEFLRWPGISQRKQVVIRALRIFTSINSNSALPRILRKLSQKYKTASGKNSILNTKI